MKMPEKDPANWQWLLDLLTPEARAALMSIFISFLRILYDEKESKWQRIFLESTLCGALTYGTSAGLSYFDSLPSGVSIFFGAMIGFLGVDFVRSRAKKLVDKRIENDQKDITGNKE